MATWNNAVPNRKAMHMLKREALLREAIAAFNQKGFHATSLDDIAASLGVTKAALYHYFSSKHALLYEAFSEALKVGFAAIDTAEAQGGTGLVKLQTAIREYLQVTLSEMSRCIIITEEHALEPNDRSKIVEQRDRFEARLRTFVREGIDDGSIVPCDPKLAIFSIFGAVNWVPKWYSDAGAWSNRQLAQGMSELLCRSIASKPLASLAVDVGKIQPDAPTPM
ncbi:MAG TPA: TetR/AcrR family transcriptional regulator [Advenella sp.]|nr:TetR/AcrR family transcriptional regulator [Advenella sp.]